MRSLVFLLIVAAATTLHAQSNKDVEAPAATNPAGQVEITADEVSGKKTIKLRPQVLADRPWYKITMELTYDLKPEAAPTPQNSPEETVSAHLECLEKAAIEYGDRVVLFALDGEPFFVGERPGSSDSPRLQARRNRPTPPGGVRKFYTDGVTDFQLSLSQLQKLAGGTNVGIGFGAVEAYFDQSVMANIRDFANEVVRHAPKVVAKPGDVAKPSEVEIKTDRFSGDVTISMRPQTLIGAPRNSLTMELQYKKKTEASAPAEEIVGVRFDSRSSSEIDFGDEELHFLIDGRRLSIGRASSQPKAEAPMWSDKKRQGRKPDKTFYSTLSLSQINQISAGKQVEMRLGNVELVFDQTTLAAIREFAGACAAHASAEPKKKR
jgi:hypothetical protein